MGLKIFLAVVAVLTVLLLCRIKIVAGYDGDFEFKIKYLFLTFDISPGTGKKEQKPGKKAKKASKQPPKQKPKPDIKRILSLLDEYSELLKKLISDARRHLRIDRLMIRLVINEDDAAQTAILYGKACAVIWPGVAAIGSLVRIKRSEITIAPDFSGENASEFNFGCTISMRVVSGIGMAFTALAGLVKINIKKTGKNKQLKTAKDGVSQ
jgi:hypothetical protein